MRGQGCAPRRRRPGPRWRAGRCGREVAAGKSGARARGRAQLPSSAAASRLLARRAWLSAFAALARSQTVSRVHPGAPAAWSASAMSESRGHAPAAAAPLHAAISPLHTRSASTPCTTHPVTTRCCRPPGGLAGVTEAGRGLDRRRQRAGGAGSVLCKSCTSERGSSATTRGGPPARRCASSSSRRRSLSRAHAQPQSMCSLTERQSLSPVFEPLQTSAHDLQPTPAARPAHAAGPRTAPAWPAGAAAPCRRRPSLRSWPTGARRPLHARAPFSHPVCRGAGVQPGTARGKRGPPGAPLASLCLARALRPALLPALCACVRGGVSPAASGP